MAGQTPQLRVEKKPLPSRRGGIADFTNIKTGTETDKMRGQRGFFQIKEKDKPTVINLSKTELKCLIDNLK